MTSKLTVLIAGVFASLALLAGTMQGCGGSDSGSGFSATCNAGCDKVMACGADAQQVMACRASCTSIAGMHCTNEAAITAAIKSCTAMADCTAAVACTQTIPACQTTGTGGTTGSGGTSGGGGAGGTTGSGWSCQEDATNGCTCAAVAGGQATCTATYTCCVMFVLQGTQACSCMNLAAAQCTQLASGLAGTMVGDCPP